MYDMMPRMFTTRAFVRFRRSSSLSLLYLTFARCVDLPQFEPFARHSSANMRARSNERQLTKTNNADDYDDDDDSGRQ